MKLHHTLLLGTACVCIAAARAAESPLAVSRANLEKWIETRQTLAKTRADWQSDREILDQSIALFERELKTVEDQLGRVSTNNAQIDRERLEAESQKAAANGELQRWREALPELERNLLTLVPALPPPLQDQLKLLLNRIPSGTESKAGAAERMQTVVGILNEIDKFNNALSVFNEKRKDASGTEVAVEVVYIGLGAAYFVNQSNDFAGTGTSSDKGWDWKPAPDLAPAIREIIRIYRNDQPARFVSLPAQIR